MVSKIFQETSTEKQYILSCLLFLSVLIYYNKWCFNCFGNPAFNSTYFDFYQKKKQTNNKNTNKAKTNKTRN